MAEIIQGWLLTNHIQVLGAILGLIYIFFSIKQNIFTWPVGLLTSVLHVIVFFQSKLYADMGLQLYYVVISIYGWYFWLRGKTKEKKQAPVRSASTQLKIKLIFASLLLYGLILYILLRFTDSDVPYMDSLTTALSIVATWMLAKKYIGQWIIWIFVDAISAGLYVYKGLWAFVVLYLVFTLMAFKGFTEWKKDLNPTN